MNKPDNKKKEKNVYFKHLSYRVDLKFTFVITIDKILRQVPNFFWEALKTPHTPYRACKQF